MRVFIPIEDGHIDRDVVPVPYRQGLACVHGLREGFTLGQDGWLDFGPLSDESSARRPDARRSHPPVRR
jgi:hypothetical protein